MLGTYCCAWIQRSHSIVVFAELPVCSEENTADWQFQLFGQFNPVCPGFRVRVGGICAIGSE